MLDKGIVVTDNKRPAKYALTSTGYGLAEKLAPLAGIPLHVRLPTSSAGHPSSSGAGPSTSTSSGFRGRGNVLGGTSSGPRPAAHVGTSIHAAARRRASSPIFAFLDDADAAEGGHDEDVEFQVQMRKAMELSRRESAGLSSDPAVGGGIGGGDDREKARRALNGRKAASGAYAARASERRDAPALKNVGASTPLSSASSRASS